MMIKSFKDRETEKIYYQEFSKKYSKELQKIILRKLMMINSSEKLEDLKVPPGNKLEPLKGDREGCYSIRINNQYRICFREYNNDYYDVEVVDYH